MAPESQQQHVYHERAERIDTCGAQYQARFGTLQREQRPVEREEGSFAHPETKIDQEERYPGDLEQVRCLVVRHHVVQLGLGPTTITVADCVLPGIDADEHQAEDPSAENEDVGQFPGHRPVVVIPATE